MNLQQPSISSRVMPIKMGKEKSMMGGKWEVVKEFKGKSHKDGGIDIEVGGGYVRSINAQNEKPDVIAKKGRMWKNIGAGLYGAGEGLLDTLTMGATDPLTDLGYTALQKAGGSSADEIREQNSVRGYTTAAGAITGGIISGGATTGAAIQQGAKGVGAGVSQGSPDSKAAQAVGTYLPIAGSIAGMAVGNAGYGDAAKGAKAAGDTAKAAGDTAKAADYAAKAERLTKLGNVATKAGKITKFNPMIQAGMSAMNATGNQQPLNLGPVQQGIREATPYLSPSMMKSYGELGGRGGGPSNQIGQTGTFSSSSGGGGGEDGPIMFRHQPIAQESAFNYLSRYGINS
jgi:hypothetical protein